MQRIVRFKTDGACLVRLPQAALCFLITLLYLQPTIGDLFQGFFLADAIANYADELIAVFFILYFLYFTLRYPIGYFEVGLIAFSVSVLILGGVSSTIHRFQEFIPSMIDAFGFVKFPLTLTGANCFFRRHRFQQGYFSCMRCLVLLIALIYPFLILSNSFLHIFPQGDFRWFMHSQVLFYRWPANLSLICIFGMLFIYDTNKDRKNLLLMLTLSLTGMSALRAKECAVIAVFWMLHIYFLILKRKKILPITLFASAGVLLIGIRNFLDYYGNLEYARAALAVKAVEIASDFFPLGSGFGSYATGQSAAHYSMIYYQYGLSHIWGLTKEKPNFMADTFWPAIIGELGWGGSVLFLLLFFVLLMKCLSIRSNPRYFVASLCVSIYLILSSLSSQSVIGTFGVICAILLAYFWNIGKQKNGLQKLLVSSRNVATI